MVFAPPARLAQHHIPIDYLDTLMVGAGSSSITRYLWETERSRRLLLIVTLFRYCESTEALAPLPPAAGAWSMLHRARERDRAGIDDLLLHPQIGNAAAYALRRLRGGANSDLPPWLDLGLVHTLALIAAARVRMTWSTIIPARHGTVSLPTLGLARLPATAAASMVEARTEGGTIRLSAGGHEVVVEPDPTADADNWWHLRHLRVGKHLPLTVWLDDVDPFRDLADPEPPARLDDAAFSRWHHLLDDAWALLCAHHADSAAALAEGVISLVPLKAQPGRETRSASNGEAFGSVMVSEPPDAVTLAVSLVHEFQHIKLGALMHLLTFIDDEDGTLYYAPWRDDPRPLGGFLQGIYAFFGIADFWRRHRRSVTGPDAAVADYEYLYARGQTVEALRSVRDATKLSPAGRKLILGLGTEIETWQSDRLDTQTIRLARLTADSHRTAWRLRHQFPAPAEPGNLAVAWMNRLSPEVPSACGVRPAAPLRWPNRIPTMARRRLLNPSTQPALSDPLTAADRALIDGEADTAKELYLRWLADPSDNPDEQVLAWVGVTLAAAECGLDAAASALLSRPDLVRAVHAEAQRRSGRAIDPIEIADWLGPLVKVH